MLKQTFRLISMQHHNIPSHLVELKQNFASGLSPHTAASSCFPSVVAVVFVWIFLLLLFFEFPSGFYIVVFFQVD